jgi:3-hydroxy-3-methylglutaryl CoA synthase
MGWLNPSNAANVRGEKAIANFDEDSITMAVAAGRSAISGMDSSTIDGVYFASTSMPYLERQNAGIISAAMALKDDVCTTDFSGALKAGTGALLSAIDAVGAKRMRKVVITSAECRLGKPASPQELIFGDSAAAFVVGNKDVIAEFKGFYSVSHDFVDHYRGKEARFDRQWEDRWIRDMGYHDFLPEVISGLLKKYNLKISDFSKVIYDCHYAAERKNINKSLGISPEADQSNLQAEVGHCGAAHSLVMFAVALENAKPGDKILVVSYGSGCDALYFEATDNILKVKNKNSVSAVIANKAELDRYSKYLVWRNILPAYTGLRTEEDQWTRWSFLWRNRKMIMGLYGTKCRKCGTAQLPPQKVCINPECDAMKEMDEYLFSDKIGRIASFTGDMLAESFNPPNIYGQIEFEGGGKMLFDFTDCKLDDLKVGMKVAMSFRRKYYDAKRDVSGYFWKAVPMKEDK